MSNFYLSLENDPKGGPLDDFSHLTRIIQPHKIVIFIYTDTFWAHSCITSANSTFCSDLALFVVVCFVIIIVDVDVVLPSSV